MMTRCSIRRLRSVAALLSVLTLLACTESTPDSAAFADDGGGALGDSSGANDGGKQIDSAGDSAAADANTSAGVKLDILWVIDQSASMCQEQLALAAGFAKFAERLNKIPGMDAQMAVTTVQQTPDKTNIRVVGRFNTKAATAFPPNCMERRRRACTTDAQCKTGGSFAFTDPGASSMCTADTVNFGPAIADGKGGGLGEWQCKQTPVSKLSTNYNCSINNYCLARCNPDAGNADCEALFGKGSLCQTPGGGTNKDTAGCITQPDTASCLEASKQPAIVSHAQVEMLKCIATVGAAQTPESRFEGGLRAGWMALDPDGPSCDYNACVQHLRVCCADGGDWCKKDKNDAKCTAQTQELCEPLKGTTAATNACQNKRLLRPDAKLLIVMLSDDDDCSMGWDDSGNALNPLDTTTITKQVWDRCQVYGDADGGNTTLNEGHCEYTRSNAAVAGTDVYCPSDCEVGSAAQTVDKKPKCAGGCKDGSPERKTCLEQADAGLTASTKTAKAFGPVKAFADRYKKLKNSADDLFVAVIVADTLAADAPQQHRDRVDYYHSMLRDDGPGQVPYICAGARGEANYGHRYIAFAKEFGKRGFVHNICGDGDLGATLATIAGDTIAVIAAGK